MEFENLVELDAEHPGFRDAEYRRRRDHIARLATEHRTGMPVPEVDYTEDEHRLWREITQKLNGCHEAYACGEILQAQRRLALPADRIPQLEEVNASLSLSTGFRMEPVPGLVLASTFLRSLADGVFLSTQYIRHTSRPYYTPEPDVVHELHGHAATLADPRFAELSRSFGEAARAADDEQIPSIERLYWYSLEYGCVLQDGVAKAVGAGLLSSVDEIARVDGRTQLKPFRAAVAAKTDYDPTTFQVILYVARDFHHMVDECLEWLRQAVA